MCLFRRGNREDLGFLGDPVACMIYGGDGEKIWIISQDEGDSLVGACFGVVMEWGS